jgi:hypothetical protein
VCRMKRKTLIVVALALAGALAASGTALAAKGGVPGPPTTTEPTVWTCQARVDNGATAWHLGEYYEDPAGVEHYRVPMTGEGDDAWPACTDLYARHAGTRTWLIEWGGTLSKPMTGLKLVFEAEVHSGTFLETVVAPEDPHALAVGESLCVSVPATPGQAFVFVAMAKSGDKWTSSSVILTPDPDTTLCSR